jgi:hypothetical protein
MTRELPAASFSSFIVSLAGSAMTHMGQAPAGDTGVQVDIQMARHTIDLLGLLEDKTKGNLDDEEAKLLKTLLYELRTKFVTASEA